MYELLPAIYLNLKKKNVFWEFPSSPVLELLAFTAQGLGSVLVGELRLRNPCSVAKKKIFFWLQLNAFFSVHLSTSCCLTGTVGMATECWTNFQGRFSKCIKVTIFLPSSVLVTSHKFLPGGIKLSLIMNSLKFQIFYLNTLLWKFLNICKGSKNRTMNPMFPLFKLQH